MTTLIYAASKGDVRCVQDLLNKGADVNVTDEVRVDLYMYVFTCLKRAQ